MAFVNASFVVPQTPVVTGVQLATGMGHLSDFVNGAFTVPQNPVGLAGLADFVAGRFSVPYTGMGDVVPSAPMYFIDSNSVLEGAQAMGLAGCGAKHGDCGCGCSGGGMGDINVEWAKIQSDFTAGNYTGIISDTLFSIPVWAYGVGLLALFFVGGEQHSYAGRTRRSYRAARGAF